MNMLKKIYNRLQKTYGYQGWWPIRRLAKSRGFDAHGYHQQEYLAPDNFNDRFEIIVGAILTQNTSWKNVEKALDVLVANKLLNPAKIIEYPEAELAELIRSSGYYNQKAKKLKAISQFVLKLAATPTRDELLAIWGVGDETADSILLYAYQVPVFVIDAYTKRIFSRIGLVAAKTGYRELQKIFQQELPKDYKLYNEYHALIVAHGKDVCKTKPLCSECVLKSLCSYSISGSSR